MVDNLHHLLSLVFLAVIPLLAYTFISSKYSRLPPGPPRTLISGNVYQLDGIRPWLTYARWAQEYGPIFSFRVYHKHTVVLNTGKAVLDLLDARANIYSDRPTRWMVSELVGRKLAIFNTSMLHERFKPYRRMLHSALNPRAMTAYQDLQTKENRTFLRDIAQSPDRLHDHIRRNAVGVIFRVTYGREVNSVDDHLVYAVEEAVQMSAQLSLPGRWLVDTIPALRYLPSWLPGTTFQREATRLKALFRNLDAIPTDWVKEQMSTGSYEESFVSKRLRSENGEPVTEDEEDRVRWMAGALYAGGADTSVSALASFFLLMSIHPEVQKRAQEEVDRVVGTDRLPTFDDLSQLRYVHAVIKEVLRWAPVAPLGLPHRVLQDDVYEGHLIPEGVTVVANIWAVTRDENIYSSPSVFNPDRFMGDKPEMDSRKFVFGFGRRVCPGEHFALTSLAFNIANVLSVYHIAKGLDKSGNAIEPSISYTTGVTSHPEKFYVRVTPRSAQKAAMINEES